MHEKREVGGIRLAGGAEDLHGTRDAFGDDERFEREAKLLLQSDALTVAEVAYRTGFCNPAYFTNSFRRETGVTPKAWRKSPSTD